VEHILLDQHNVKIELAEQLFEYRPCLQRYEKFLHEQLTSVLKYNFSYPIKPSGKVKTICDFSWHENIYGTATLEALLLFEQALNSHIEQLSGQLRHSFRKLDSTTLCGGYPRRPGDWLTIKTISERGGDWWFNVH
jgi:hypothetical protein